MQGKAYGGNSRLLFKRHARVSSDCGILHCPILARIQKTSKYRENYSYTLASWIYQWLSQLPHFAIRTTTRINTGDSIPSTRKRRHHANTQWGLLLWELYTGKYYTLLSLLSTHSCDHEYILRRLESQPSNTEATSKRIALDVLW